MQSDRFEFLAFRRFGAAVWVVGWLLAVCLSNPASAQLPEIRLDKFFPQGGAVGSSVDVEIEGIDLDDARRLVFEHDGITAVPLDEENTFRVTIEENVPPRLYDVRVIGKYGVSNPFSFEVSTGLEEILETTDRKQPNHSFENAQRVPFSCIVNGYSSGPDPDYFVFSVEAGQRVIVDCRAERMGSLMNAVLEVFDSQGRQVATNLNHFGFDPLVDFTAVEDGDITVKLYDFSFGYNRPYRLAIGELPIVESLSTTAISDSGASTVTLLGRNLPGGKRSEVELDGQPLEEYTLSLTPPDGLDRYAARFLMPLPSRSIETELFQLAIERDGLVSNPLPIAMTPGDVVPEQEPNDTFETAQPLPIDHAVSGRFSKRGDNDWFQFSAEKGQRFAIDVTCTRLGWSGDPVVLVFDADGDEVAELDDRGREAQYRGYGFRSLNMDPHGIFTAPEDGEYRLLIRDLYGRGGPRYRYLLQVRQPQPDFVVAATAISVRGNQSPVIPRLLRTGGQQYLDIVLLRQDGFEGEVVCQATGLPPGVHAEPATIGPHMDRGIMVLSIDDDAPDWEGPIGLIAKATIDGREIEREAYFSTHSVWSRESPIRAASALWMAVRNSPSAPFALQATAVKSTIVRGEPLEVHVQLDRRWSDFNASVKVDGLNMPTYIQTASATIEAGQTEVTLKFPISPASPPRAGRYTLAVTGLAKVPFRATPEASPTEVLVTLPSNPIHIEVVPE